MISKRIPKLLIGGIIILGVLTGAYVGIIKFNANVKAETIIIEDTSLSEQKEDSSIFSKITDSINNLNVNSNSNLHEYIEVIGWSINDKLLFFKGTIRSTEEEKVLNATLLKEESEEDTLKSLVEENSLNTFLLRERSEEGTLNYTDEEKILNTILLEERSETGEIYKTHEIQFEMDKYNKTLVSNFLMTEPNYIDHVKYTILLSPDKEKVLISTEIINSKEVAEDQYRITNKGYSAICNLKTGKVTFIDDDSRFVKWSSDSKHVFGINYAACYYKYMPAPYDQHFFPAYTYRNVSYNIEEKKVDVITEDKALYESLTINKDTYDNILNNPDLKARKRFLLGYQLPKTKEVQKSKYRVEQHLLKDQLSLNYILDVNEEGQYMFIGRDYSNSPAIYVGEKGNGQKKKIFESFVPNYSSTIINGTNLLYIGESSSSVKSYSSHSFSNLNMYNLESGKGIILYEGKTRSFAYSPKSEIIAIYDDVKKDILIGKLVNEKITDLKSYYKVNMRAFDMYLNEDGSKLYFEGGYKDIDGVIDVKSGEVTKLREKQN